MAKRTCQGLKNNRTGFEERKKSQNELIQETFFRFQEAFRQQEVCVVDFRLVPALLP